jgi:hypothetical protein
MTFVSGTFSTAQTNAEVVAGQPGMIIRIIKIAFGSWAGVKLTLISSPGSDPVAMTPPLYIAGGRTLVLPLGRALALATDAGKGLGVTTVFQSTAAEHSVMIWYELVKA